MKKTIHLNEKELRHLIAENIEKILDKNNMNMKGADLNFKRSEADIDEEEKQFYEKLGSYCYDGLDCFRMAIDLINSPYGMNHEEELRNILKNLEHICDRIENIWENYAD